MKEHSTVPPETASAHTPPPASVPPSNADNASPTLRPTPSALRPTLLRRAVQCCFALFLAWVGWNFYCFVLWATGKTAVYTPKPPSVEGFLPISELMAARRFFATGQWDFVHPAGLTLFLAIALMRGVVKRHHRHFQFPGALAAKIDNIARKRRGRLRGPRNAKGKAQARARKQRQGRQHPPGAGNMRYGFYSCGSH